MHDIIIAPFIGIAIQILLLLSPLSFIGWLYLAWFFYDCRTPERGSRPNPNTRKWRLYKLIQSYFPIKLIKTAELSPEHNYLIGTHPHGVLAFGPFISLCTDAAGFDKFFPGIECTIATLKGMFWFPIRREQVLMMSSLIAVNKESIRYYLNQKPKGRALAVVVGGANEVLSASPYTYNICLANRKGFVREAIINGAHLVPMFNFGENDYYYQLPNGEGTLVRKIQNIIKIIITYSPTIVIGRGFFSSGIGFMPYRRPITCVMGKPIEVKRNPNPTQQEIDELHKRYCLELKQLFDKFKVQCGVNKTTELTFY
uniref:Acyltransferase n=1 Tax=Syphacia muris TaxID=451379 RepID=A0A0N5B1F8_9BILA